MELSVIGGGSTVLIILISSDMELAMSETALMYMNKDTIWASVVQMNTLHIKSKAFSISAQKHTVDSRYLEFQGTLWNTSRYPYLDISDLQNWGKNNSNNHI